MLTVRMRKQKIIVIDVLFWDKMEPSTSLVRGLSPVLDHSLTPVLQIIASSAWAESPRSCHFDSPALKEGDKQALLLRAQCEKEV